MLILNIVRNKIFYTATSYLNGLIFTPIAFLINAKNIPKYSFRGFRGVNISKSWEIALNHCGCTPTGFIIFLDHFIIFNLYPDISEKKLGMEVIFGMQINIKVSTNW